MPYTMPFGGGFDVVLVLGALIMLPMLIQWDGTVWALATPQRRRWTAVIALVLAAVLTGTTTFAFFSENCYPDWLCGAFGVCGGC